MENKITIVIPVSDKAHIERFGYEGLSNYDVALNYASDLVRVKLFLLPSINKFFDKNSLHEIIFLVPDDQLESLSPKLNNPINHRVMKDSDLIGGVEFVGGWYKQQALKLSVSKFVETERYLILDADMFCTRGVTFDDLVINGKTKIGTCPYHCHKDWWENTAQFMGYDINYHDDYRTPGLTPQIFHKSLVNGLIDKLQDKFGEVMWIQGLASNCPFTSKDPIKWTEYCLYWIYVINEVGLYDHYYESTDTILIDKSIWREDDYAAADDNYYRDMFNPISNHYFSVIQSNIKSINSQELYAKIGKYFTGNIHFVSN